MYVVAYEMSSNVEGIAKVTSGNLTVTMPTEVPSSNVLCVYFQLVELQQNPTGYCQQVIENFAE